MDADGALNVAMILVFAGAVTYVSLIPYMTGGEK